MESLIALCTDICKRNGIKALCWHADKTLIGQVERQNMTVHRWFAQKSCPGEYLYGKMGYIADEVNKRLGVSAPTAKPAPGASAGGITVGSRAMIVGDRYAARSGGSVIPGWAKSTSHVVSRIDGEDALLGASGGINSWVAVADVRAV
jgi:hypothetical protein